MKSITKIAALTVLCFVLLAVSCGCNSQPTSANMPESYLIKTVKPINQNPNFPTACESVCAVMALRNANYSVTVSTFVDKCIDRSYSFYIRDEQLYGPDPYQFFCGEPRADSGYGCFAPVIEKGIKRATNSKKSAVDTTGVTLDALCQKYVINDQPVIVWATVDMQESTPGKSWLLTDGTEFVWPFGEHALLLIGYDSDTYIFADPMVGETVHYDKALTTQRYEELGSQSVAVTASKN